MFEIRNVTVADVLCARDERAKRQQAMLEKYRAPLISFTMNIAGDVKVNGGILRAFREGKKRIVREIERLHATVYACEETLAFTGCECLWAVECDAHMLKEQLCRLEEQDELGRLFDMDVMDERGVHVKREGERPCLICGKPVRACARARKHTADELLAKTMRIIDGYFEEAYVSRVGEMARKALLQEAVSTPKPGLVDMENSGAHRDMDLSHFKISADALQPYFEDCARLGIKQSGPEALQRRGMDAEKEMIRAVGVNTHKGAIFALGILCYAHGKCGEDADLDTVLFAAAELGGYYLGQLQQKNPMLTGGEKQYASLGLTGARGEAASGFHTVRHVALPVMENALRRGCDLNDAGLETLVHLMCCVMDSNVLRRGGEEALQYVQETAKTYVQKGFSHADLRLFNDELVKRDLSPGGSADLLAVTYFLHFMFTDEGARRTDNGA